VIAYAIVCWQITGISAFNGPFENHFHIIGNPTIFNKTSVYFNVAAKKLD